MRRVLLLTLLLRLTGCAEPEGDLAFDEDGDDQTVSADGKADRTGSYQPGCTKLSVPTYALGGTLLTPNGPVSGYVVVQDERISAVVASRADVPAGAAVLETGGVISPGLIDLHNHVGYDFLPLWNSGRHWQNRYQWARAAAYSSAVKSPYNAIKNAGHLCEATKYGEFRALVGGTTTIQGSNDMPCIRSWVRNVEYTNFCQDRIRQSVLPISTLSQTDAAKLRAQFASGAVQAFFVHLAEGVDDASRNEFEQLRALGLLAPQVVGIHSTALTDSQLAEMGQIGMKIVWSPLSNMILYGHTTNIPAALKAGVLVSLGSDWSPSGSANLLWELKAADRVNREQFGGTITDQQLWQMVTSNPAQTAGLGDKLGAIAPGYFADLVVLRPAASAANPYRALIDAQPADVVLTTISGQALYGDPALLETLGQHGRYDIVSACGVTRGLVDTDTNGAIPRATESLSDVLSAFTNDGVTNPVALFQCSPAPDWAFGAGTNGF